jgi:hypothetical protein
LNVEYLEIENKKYIPIVHGKVEVKKKIIPKEPVSVV